MGIITNTIIRRKIMTELNDNYRMYGLVPYNISPIQQGIQFGHAVQEYNNMMMDTSAEGLAAFNEWRKECKTFIILNGGTTNKRMKGNFEFTGSLNKHLDELVGMGIQVATFEEPDLGDQLTAVVFLVPNTVYNKELVPDFWDWEPAVKAFKEFGTPRRLLDFKFGEIHAEDFDDAEKLLFNEWVELVGGEKYVRLRFFLQNFRLA